MLARNRWTEWSRRPITLNGQLFFIRMLLGLINVDGNVMITAKTDSFPMSARGQSRQRQLITSYLNSERAEYRFNGCHQRGPSSPYRREVSAGKRVGTWWTWPCTGSGWWHCEQHPNWWIHSITITTTTNATYLLMKMQVLANMRNQRSLSVASVAKLLYTNIPRYGSLSSFLKND